MGLEIIAAGTGLFAAATGVPQYFEQKQAANRAAREQRKANETSQASAQIENARQRRRALAQARVIQAQNQAAQSSAVAESSTLSGVQSGISTQLGANIGAQQQRIGAQRTIQGYQQSAADAMRQGQERVGMWNAAGNIANMAMSFGMGAGSSGGANTGGYLNSATAGSQRTGYTNNQFQTWLNNQ